MENSRVNGLADPAESIEVQVGKINFAPKWTFLSEYSLSEKGLSLGEILTALNLGKPQAVSLGMELLAAMMIHAYPKRTAAQWAAMVAPGQYAAIIGGLLACGRRDGAIVDRKNAEAPVQTMPPALDPSPDAPLV